MQGPDAQILNMQIPNMRYADMWILDEITFVGYKEKTKG